MLFYTILIFSLLSSTFITVRTQDVEIFSNLLDGGLNPMQNFKADLYIVENKIQAVAPEKVEIKLYYECLCGPCRKFDTGLFKLTVETLASYLDVHLYPYGGAQTIDYGNGTYDFKCEHGPKECYGNKLHACAIEHLGNITKAVFFNSCMMELSRTDHGSNDEAADECGKRMNVDPEWIKQCAKGDRGNQLLKYYGDETKKLKPYRGVPSILVNGVNKRIINIFEEVCAAFKTPPPECAPIFSVHK